MRVTKTHAIPVLPVLILVVSVLIGLLWAIVLLTRAKKVMQYVQVAQNLETMRMNGGKPRG